MMKHVRCCALLFLVIAASCVKTERAPIAPAEPRLDVPAGTVQKARAADYPTDVIVSVKQRSVVYVFHAQKLRALIVWPAQKQGDVVVPVGRIADTPGKNVYVGVTAEESIVKSFEDPSRTGPSPIALICHGCYSDEPNDGCCPNTN